MNLQGHESPFDSHTQAVTRLEEVMAAKLVAPDRVGFCESLIRAWRESRCSEKQLMWIHILAEGAVTAERRSVDVTNIALLMSVAKARGLKQPRIRLGGGLTIKEGWREGAIVVVRAGRGLIAETQPGSPVMVMRERASKDDEELVRRVASNPARECAVIGIRTNHCCFCGLTLTTPESVGNGYGPVCADNWGLPWANTPAARRESKIRELLELKNQMEKPL